VALVTDRLARFQWLIDVGQNVAAVGRQGYVCWKTVLVRRAGDRLCIDGKIPPRPPLAGAGYLAILDKLADPALRGAAGNFGMPHLQFVERQTGGRFLNALEQVDGDGHGLAQVYWDRGAIMVQFNKLRHFYGAVRPGVYSGERRTFRLNVTIAGARCREGGLAPLRERSERTYNDVPYD